MNRTTSSGAKLSLISTPNAGPHPRQTATNHAMTSWERATQAFTDYLNAGGRTRRTITLRRYWLDRLARDFHDRSPWAITPLELTSWLASGGWGPETKRSIRATVRVFYGWAVDMNLTTVDPSRGLPAVKIPRRVPRPTPDDITEAACARAAGRDLLMLRLALNAGLRREEIAALRWVALDGRWLTITGKGGHERRVPLPAELVEMLVEERARRREGQIGPGWRFAVDPGSPFVFPGLRGGHMHVDSVGSILSGLLGRSGFAGHTLRHRFATKTLRGSRNLRATQELLGHASILTTQAYTQVVDDDLIEAAQWAA